MDLTPKESAARGVIFMFFRVSYEKNETTMESTVGEKLLKSEIVNHDSIFKHSIPALKVHRFYQYTETIK